jgi:hypothetical protein
MLIQILKTGWTICPDRLLNVRGPVFSCLRRYIHSLKGLRKAVAIPSVSAADEHRKDVVKVCLGYSNATEYMLNLWTY